MHILFISRWFPFPPDNGAKIRIYNLLKYLSRDHDLTLLSFTENNPTKDQFSELRTYCSSVRTAPLVSYNPGGFKAIAGFFSARPRFLVDTFSSDMTNLVKEQALNRKFDVVVASQIDTILYGLYVDNTPRILEELELQTIFDQYRKERIFLQKARYALTWYKTSRFVSRVLEKHYHGCTVVSEKERKLISGYISNKVELAVVPNGVDIEKYKDGYGPPKPDTICYPGALTYSANFDAVYFFLDKVLPAVKQQHPNVKFYITGDYHGVPIDRLRLDDGTILTGHVPDIRPVVARAWACVVPLRIGGGTRIKILEAMALGTPVVSTSKGAEGLDVTDGHNILLADTPDSFAGALCRLLDNISLRRQLSKNGRDLIEKRYAWNVCIRPLEQMLHRVAEKTNNYCGDNGG